MEKLLVIGVDTSIGATLAQALKERSEVTGISFGPVVDGDDIPSRPVRRGDGQQLATAIEQAEANCLIYAGRFSLSSWDMPSADAAWEQEAQMADTLTEAARRSSAKLIALSSDVVFAGPKLFHDETAPTTSAHAAAETILQWEQSLLAGGALVARTSAYTWAAPGGEAGLVERITHALRTGQPAPVDGQRFATPIFAGDLAPLLLRAAQRNLAGLYHLSGTERTSSFRLANQLASLLGVSLPCSHGGQQCRAADENWLVETSLDSRRARRALDLGLPMLADGLERFVAAEPGVGVQVTRRAPVEQAA